MRKAAFTIVQNEPVYLPIWLEFYGRHFPDRDLYVLHHPRPGEDPRSDWIAGLEWKFQLIPVFREESFNHVWLRDTVAAFQKFLLKSYEAVLFAEVDEIVVPDPRTAYKGDLAKYIDDFMPNIWAVRCSGYEVVHDPDNEPAIDFDKRPILAQRSRWYPSRAYSKTLLARCPLTWVTGFHAASESPERSDPNLLLIHLHKIDFEMAKARHLAAASQRWSERDIRARRGMQNRITNEAELRRWFVVTIDNEDDQPALFQPLPDEIKALL